MEIRLWVVLNNFLIVNLLGTQKLTFDSKIRCALILKWTELKILKLALNTDMAADVTKYICYMTVVLNLNWYDSTT